MLTIKTQRRFSEAQCIQISQRSVHSVGGAGWRLHCLELQRKQKNNDVVTGFSLLLMLAFCVTFADHPESVTATLTLLSRQQRKENPTSICHQQTGPDTTSARLKLLLTWQRKNHVDLKSFYLNMSISEKKSDTEYKPRPQLVNMP